jgi:hypothetical protein
MHRDKDTHELTTPPDRYIEDTYKIHRNGAERLETTPPGRADRMLRWPPRLPGKLVPQPGLAQVS